MRRKREGRRKRRRKRRKGGGEEGEREEGEGWGEGGGGGGGLLTAFVSSYKSFPWWFNPPSFCRVSTCSLVNSACDTTSFRGQLRATSSAF